MSLYPTTTIPITDTSSMYTIPSGCMTVFPFTFITGQTLAIALMHLAYTEDFSMRIWFSSLPGGIAIVGDYNTSFYPMLREPTIATLYDSTLTRPDTIRTYSFTEGNYYLNILNLINLENVFSKQVITS